MDVFVELMKEINAGQILVILAGIWFFYSRLDNKIDRLEARSTEEMKKLGDKIEDVDRRLCRIEGSLSVHGHCLFNQTKPGQRAE